MNKGHVGGTATAAKLNSKMRESVVAFLLSHVAAADGVLAQLQISLLETMELVTSQLFVSQLFPLVTSHTKSLEHIGVPATGSIDDKLTHSLFKAFFSPSNASAIAGGSDKHFDTLLKFVKGVAKVPGSKFAEWSSDLRAKAYLQQVAFEYLTADFVASLGSQPALASITQCLFDVATLGNSYYVPGATKATVRDLFSKVPLDPATVSESLTVVAGKLAQDDSDTPRSGKRARGSHTKSPVDVLPELSTLLEYVQCSVLLSTNPILAPALFSLLSVFVSDLSTQTTADEGSSESLAAQAKELVSIDYLKQLVLTMLTRIFDEANKAGAVIEESVVRVDVIVQSIRTSSSPQTHNQTLLLLAAVAVQHPQAVLHHVMAIFTFMGANVLRQDDEYSFRVLNQTLEKVIPPLVKAKPGEQRISKHEEVALAGPILRVFVDTLSHIPRHRRMALFT
ncbi:snoRNA-binding rRNA-processing protein utp10, partial [Linderina macrospora]